MITPLLIAALQAVPGSAAQEREPDPVRAVFEVPSVGQVVLTESPSPGLSAIRIFVPVQEQFGESGAGRVLTELATERVRGVAARTGARFSATRTQGGVAYVVTGSDLDLDYLFLVGARAVTRPTDGRVALGRAVQRITADLDSSAETGRGWVIASLTDRMCPTSPRWVGSVADLSTLDASDVDGFWARTHGRGSAVVTISTSLPRAIVLAGLDLLGAQLATPVAGAEAAPPAGLPTPRAPSVLRRWYGEARPVPLGHEAAALIVGELLESRLDRQADDYELYAELRETACGPAFVAVGSAFRGGERVMRRRVSALPGELTADLDPTHVAEAAAALRLRMLSLFDTPTQKARAVGSLFEGSTSVPDLLKELELVRLSDVVAFLEQTTANVPMRAEVNP